MTIQNNPIVGGGASHLQKGFRFKSSVFKFCEREREREKERERARERPGSSWTQSQQSIMASSPFSSPVWVSPTQPPQTPPSSGEPPTSISYYIFIYLLES